MDRGYSIVGIGLGTPARAAKFIADEALPYPVYGDRDGIAYAAYGLGQGALQDVVNPKLVLGGLRALRSGAMPGRPSGDPAQLPGTFIVDTRGIVRFAKPASIASDIAESAELLAWIDGER